MMRLSRLLSVAVLAASLGACAAKAQVRTEPELPLLDPPPPPPRVVAQYPEDVAPAQAPPPEALPAPERAPARPPRPESKPVALEPVQGPGEVRSPLSLTLTPAPGTEAQTAAAIRDLLARAARDLSRVNVAALNTDGRAQFETARRFLQQAEEALTAGNVVFAGKLADKAAIMAALLVR